MTRTSLIALALCSLLIPATAYADGAILQRAGAAHLNSQAGVHAATIEGAKGNETAAFEGGGDSTAVYAGETDYRGTGLIAPRKIADAGAVSVPGPQLPASEEGRQKSKIPKWASYAAGAALGGLQGALSYGLVGALGGAAMGLGISYLYAKGDYGGALGASAGSILGGAFGGPIGAVVGGLLGGLLGHLIGKLF